MNASVGAGKYEVITWLLTHIARHKLQSTLPAKTQFTQHPNTHGLRSRTQMPFASSLISPKWMGGAHGKCDWKMLQESGEAEENPVAGKCEEKIVALN